MPHTEPRLFQDLGKATRRGVRKCPKCGTMTGTRGRSCKNPSCDVVFRDIGDAKKLASDSESCCIATIAPVARVFSVRIRDRGPDYRTFVQLPLYQPCIGTPPSLRPKSISFGSRCFLETCSRSKLFPCNHIKAAENSTRESQRILIKESVISTIKIPAEAKQILTPLITQMSDTMVQRCSKASFVVKCNITSRHPLGYLHILFFKTREDGINEQKFLCNCQPIKLLRRKNSLDAGSCDNPNKYCLHYFACICAFASDENLKSEFKCILSRAFDSNLNSERIFENQISNDVESEQVNEEMEHPNRISVEVMRENLSLLESIAEVNGDHSPEVQNVESILSDEAGVTSPEDTLSFGDSSTLDSIDEPDPNRSSHLTHICEILNHGNQNNHVACQAFKSGEAQFTQQSVVIENNLGDGNSITGITPPSSSNESVKQDLQPCEKITKAPPKRARSNQNKKGDKELVTLSSINEGIADLGRRIISTNFERWLASVNERMNAYMNYQFDPICSLVENIPNEIFECLKDRIISAYKGKRYQSQTMVIVRKDRPPFGSFTKYVWRIFNIIHLLHIFQSNQVPLKLSQFFIHLSNGTYSEWSPFRDSDGDGNEGKINKNQHIIPVLHCTKLKIGRLDSVEKEFTPFVIEWIPDILPQSKMGELSIQFQVTHTGPIHTEEERRACNAPIQRVIQQRQTLSIIK